MDILPPACRCASAPDDSPPRLPLIPADSDARCPTDGRADPGWRLVDDGVLAGALEALQAVIDCEPFADVSPPGTEGFVVYELVAAAREQVARALGVIA